MEVGENPGAVGTLVLLDRLMCSLPIAFGIPPQSCLCVCEAVRRVRCGERLAKIVQSHMREVSDNMGNIFTILLEGQRKMRQRPTRHPGIMHIPAELHRSFAATNAAQDECVKR
jgi:hypothetical protein